MTRLIGRLVPARLYHWLVLHVARLPLISARSLRHSVVFRHPLHPRGRHYVAVPTRYAAGILDLPRSEALNLQEDIQEWIAPVGWDLAVIVVNFGAYQETPFLHIHLIRASEPPTARSPAAGDWLVVELDDDAGPVESGRRVVRYNALEGAAVVTTEVNRA
ncbi:MAG: hypothetical protein F4052_06025 [Dehalococcoidia bacterium]|nr:hypothetical protein [Dehalococcoidia bacterium]MYK26490.1 hypothetical protein [Dehalococcoidia bacterium]